MYKSSLRYYTVSYVSVSITYASSKKVLSGNVYTHPCRYVVSLCVIPFLRNVTYVLLHKSKFNVVSRLNVYVSTP